MSNSNGQPRTDCWECGSQLQADWMEDTGVRAGSCPDCGTVTQRVALLAQLRRALS